jgi:hypothetical protein
MIIFNKLLAFVLLLSWILANIILSISVVGLIVVVLVEEWQDIGKSLINILKE